MALVVDWFGFSLLGGYFVLLIWILVRQYKLEKAFIYEEMEHLYEGWKRHNSPQLKTASSTSSRDERVFETRQDKTVDTNNNRKERRYLQI